MAQEMITIPKEEYKRMKEEIGILNNPEMMEAIEESEEAERNGVKGWKINY
tara:strand:- start:6 stop:158 length:153 start_codon:yes stop_codon:yes gene_type:complete